MNDIVIIEDHEPLKNNLIEIIEEESGFSCVGAYSSCEEALERIHGDLPDVVLMDISLPGINGIQGTKLITRKLPECKVLIVSVHDNSKMVFDALCAGALGYITKNLVAKRLIPSIKEMVEGGSPMSANIARMVVESFQFKKLPELTDRESDVLEMLVKGNSYVAISKALFVSINTVKYHIRNIYEKLHVNNRQEAIQEAQRRNIIN